jgi:TonB-dependent receptor
MKKTLFFLFFLISSVGSFSQNTVISGIVNDKVGPLPGVAVSVKNTTKGITTNSDGRFQLSGLTVSDSLIQFSMIGYELKVLSIKGRVGQLNLGVITLDEKKNGYQLDGVDIVAEMAEGEAKAIDMTKLSPRQMNVISASTAAKLPDRNVAEAVQRIPGVVLERDQGEGRFISFRGTPSDWSSATVNGDRLPAADEESRTRAINFDILPTNLVEYTAVSKTLTPDIEGDAIGGSANFLTRFPVSERTLQFSLGGGMNFQAQAPVGNGSFLYGDISKNKKWSFVTGASFYSRNWATDNYQIFYGGNLNHALTRLELRDYKGVRNTIGSNAAVQFQPNDKWKFHVKAIQGGMDDNEWNRKTMYNWSTGVGQSIKLQNIHNVLSNRFYGGEAGLQYNPKKHKTLQFKVASYQNEFRYGAAPFKGKKDTRNGYYVLEFEKALQFTDFLYLDENGQQTDELNAYERFKFLDIDSPVEGYGDPYTNIQPTYKNNVPVSPSDTMFIFTRAYTETNQTRERDPIVLQLDWSDKRAKMVNYKTGLKYRNKVGFRKVGLEVWERNPAFPKPLIYNNYNPKPLDENGGFLQELGTPYAGKMFPFFDNDVVDNFIEGRGDTLVYRPFGVNTPYYNQFIGSSYSYTENVAAGYFMADVFLTPSFSFNAGIRSELTQVEVRADSVVEDLANLTRYLVPTSAGRNYWAILPMLNFKIKSGKNSQFRGAITRSFRRPNFNEMKPGTAAIDYTNFDVVFGNTQLRPSFAWNADVMFEKYINQNGLISLGGFYKYVTDHIYTAFESSSADNNGISNQFQIPGGVIAKKYQNAPYANIAGLEANLSFKFSFLPGNWKHFGLTANYSYTWSELKIESRDKLQALPRQSPNVANLAFFYDAPKFTIRFAGNYKDPFLYELNLYAVKDPKTGNPIVVHQDNSYDMYVGRMFSLDASATWSFSKRFTLTAEANNLTNTPYVIYRGRPERPVKTEYYSIRALIGLRFTL